MIKTLSQNLESEFELHSSLVVGIALVSFKAHVVGVSLLVF